MYSYNPVATLTMLKYYMRAAEGESFSLISKLLHMGKSYMGWVSARGPYTLPYISEYIVAALYMSVEYLGSAEGI